MGCEHNGFRDHHRTYHCGSCDRDIGKPLMCGCNAPLLDAPLSMQGGKFFLTCEKCNRQVILFEPPALPITRFVSLDIETTGLTDDDELIEIAAIREVPGQCKGLSELETFHRIYRPLKRSVMQTWEPSRWIFNETKWNNIETMKEELLAFLGNDIIVGRNVVDFDLRFLRRYGVKLANATFDVASFYGGRISLEECCQRAGIIRRQSHRAWDCIRIVRKELGLDPM